MKKRRSGMVLFLIIFVFLQIIDIPSVASEEFEEIENVAFTDEPEWEEVPFADELKLDELQEETNEEVEDRLDSLLTTVSDAEEMVESIQSEKNGTHRVVIYTKNLSNTYGASSILYYPAYEEYVLEFYTEDEAMEAWRSVKSDYDCDCYVDECLDDILMEGEAVNDNWGLKAMGLERAKDRKIADSLEETCVAVIDTGISADNPMFNDRVCEDSYDFVDYTTEMNDSFGHGTHTAGIIAQCTPDSVKIMSLRVFDNAGHTTWLLLNSALQYALEHDADVINLSLGIVSKWGASDCTELDLMISEAKKAGVPICCAAGNEGLDVSRVYPACSEDTYAISAINEKGEFAVSFGGSGGSGYGEGISFCAPGVGIVSAARTGGYLRKSGTSCACAFVSAAMVILKGKYPHASSDYLKKKAIALSVDLGEEGKDPYYGWGLIRFQFGISINDCKVSLSPQTCVYNGKAHMPQVRIWHGGEQLSKGRDYELVYTHNTTAGDAQVLVTGIGRFEGTVIKRFWIQKALAPIIATDVKRISRINDQSFRLITICKAPLCFRSDRKEVLVDKGGRVSIHAGFVGEAVITMSVKDTSNYQSTPKRIRIMVDPPPTSFKAVSEKSRRADLRWRVSAIGTGYEIQYSYEKRFRKKRTISIKKRTIKNSLTPKLKKGKRCYFRIRVIYRASGKKYGSEWSRIRSIKVY